MKTAIQLAMEKVEALEAIPLITDPLGKSWDQPHRNRIEVDATHALMSTSTFEALAEYSGSKPSGVYPGKMWKRHDGIYDYQFIAKGGKPIWMLCWYGYTENPNYCSNNYRIILLADGELPNE